MLAEGEREVPNPGNKRCKLCGGLITDETAVYYGCNVRHKGCERGVLPPLRGGENVKRPSPPPKRHFRRFPKGSHDDDC